MQIFAEDRTLRIYIYLTDDGYPEFAEPAIRELVERLNATIVFGRFVYAAGPVRYEYGFDAYGRSATPRMMERTLKASALALALWRIAVERLITTGLSAQQALDVAMQEEGAKEAPGLESATLRALLTVHHSDVTQTLSEPAPVKLHLHT